jgi:hypothetical protein
MSPELPADGQHDYECDDQGWPEGSLRAPERSKDDGELYGACGPCG